MTMNGWLRRLAENIILGLLLAGCTLPGRQAEDPLAVYRPALRPAAQRDLTLVQPISRYYIEATVDVSNLRLSGRERLVVANTNDMELPEVYLRLYPNLPQYGGQMRIQKVMLEGLEVPFAYVAERTAIKIPLVHPIPAGGLTTLDLSFTVDIPQGQGDYTLFGYRQDILSLPDFYPMLAVHDDHGWHLDVAPTHADAVFSQVALYDVSLTVPAGMTVVASGSMAGKTDNADGTVTWHDVGGPLREFAAIISDRYRVLSTTAYGTTVNAYYLPGDEVGAQAALWHAAAALRVYDDAFGPYPLAEFDVVEAPLAARGMEYPGMTLLGSDLYTGDRRGLEFLIAHEVGHQWWYAQVGSDPIRQPWLDEGLTEYTAYTYYWRVHGRRRADALLNNRWLIPYQYAVDNGLDAVVDQPADAFHSSYEVIVYGKAALFFHVLQEAVGDETYYAILRAYLKQYKYKTATGDDFLRVAEAVSGQDLQGLYNEWIYGAK